jgi:hypothetical protein
METSPAPAQPTGPKALSDSEVVELWLRRQRSSATRSVYRRDMARLGTWSDKTLSETDPFDLERFAEMLAGSGLAPISPRGGRSPPSAASSGSRSASGTAGTWRPDWNCRAPSQPSRSGSSGWRTFAG